MRIKLGNRVPRLIAYLSVLMILTTLGWFTRDYWLPGAWKGTGTASGDADSNPVVAGEPPAILKLGSKARENLGLVSAPVSPGDTWKKIQLPGVIEDRPGLSDRGVVSPLAGVVTDVYAFEGEIVRPGQVLFRLRLVSEYLQQSQTDLYKATREVEVLLEEIGRIQQYIESGTIPGKRKIDLEQQISRQNALIDAQRQDLLSRGLTASQIALVAKGEFVTSIEVSVPPGAGPLSEFSGPDERGDSPLPEDMFEVQELKVELGQQVESGSVLCMLANHRYLMVRAFAFRNDAASLALAAENKWDVDIQFSEGTEGDWPELKQTFRIRHLSNRTDPENRTFDVFVELENQSSTYESDGRTFVVWRFRPGQRVTVMVPVELMKDVIELPAEAVVFEGAEAFVFQQNGDLFNRIPVHVLHQDSTRIIIANDGSVLPGFFLASNSAASLNRVLKAQAASGIRADVHVHADGTVHAAH
jgi:membrane fusion protein, heavy metal efflux system